MSEYFHITCKTCDDRSDTLGNKVGDQICALAQEWPAIKSVLALIDRLPFYNVEFSVLGGGEESFNFTSFMRKHADHILELVGYDREPLIVGGAPKVNINVLECSDMPDGMWALVQKGQIVASNFEPFIGKKI